MLNFWGQFWVNFWDPDKRGTTLGNFCWSPVTGRQPSDQRAKSDQIPNYANIWQRADLTNVFRSFVSLCFVNPWGVHGDLASKARRVLPEIPHWPKSLCLRHGQAHCSLRMVKNTQGLVRLSVQQTLHGQKNMSHFNSEAEILGSLYKFWFSGIWNCSSCFQYCFLSLHCSTPMCNISLARPWPSSAVGFVFCAGTSDLPVCFQAVNCFLSRCSLLVCSTQSAGYCCNDHLFNNFDSTQLVRSKLHIGTGLMITCLWPCTLLVLYFSWLWNNGWSLCFAKQFPLQIIARMCCSGRFSFTLHSLE